MTVLFFFFFVFSLCLFCRPRNVFTFVLYYLAILAKHMNMTLSASDGMKVLSLCSQSGWHIRTRGRSWRFWKFWQDIGLHSGAIHLSKSVISMNFLKSAHSLIFKMLKNAGKSWKILFTLIIPRALNFSALPRDLLQGRSAGFSVVHGLSNSLFVSKQVVLSFVFLFRFRFHRLNQSWSWILSQRFVSLLLTSTSFVLLQKKKLRAPSHI